MRRLLSVILGFCICVPSFSQVRDLEPSVELAKLWWPDQYNVWTPVSWPDHYFKFNVLYNGTVIMSPSTQRWRSHSHRFVENNHQLMFCASQDGHPWKMPQGRALLREWDGGLGIQHWAEGHAAPVLCTEFRSSDGVVLETRMFTHIEGGGPVQTALEPLYAWIRVSVKHVDPHWHPDTYKMSATLSRLWFYRVDDVKLSSDICIPANKPGGVKALSLALKGNHCQLVHPDGSVRMAVLPGDGAQISLEEVQGYSGLYNLCMTFPAEEGKYVDLILPMLPTDPEAISKEIPLSFEGALMEADRRWEERLPSSAAIFDVPEPFINKAVKSNIDFTTVLAEKDYENGEYCYLSGSWGYDALWSTPAAWVGFMMDYLGLGEEVEKYDAVFAHTQGTVRPPGPAYKLHPGYLATPPHAKSIDWLSDHGAILTQVANHALLTGDETFIAYWTEPIVKACEFIMEYSMSKHEGVAGLLPPGWATDEAIPQQAVSIIGWNYLGMREATRLLHRISHPRAEEFSRFLATYKETFLKAYREIVETGPRWTDSKGDQRYKPSTILSNEHGKRSRVTDAFYLDGGPLCLVWCGLMDADDPIMEDLVDFFREGPNWALRKPFAWSCDRPVLMHEISTCEPCYSYNAFHSWQKGDRQHYLEAMYSILVGAVSQNTFISCEHRHGMMGNQFAFPLGFMLARLAVIDDRIAEGDLHLLRFCPQAWITPDRPSKFLKMPTEFGPVDLSLQLSQDGRTLNVAFEGKWRTDPGKIVLHVPPIPGLKNVSVNGRCHPASKAEILLK